MAFPVPFCILHFGYNFMYFVAIINIPNKIINIFSQSHGRSLILVMNTYVKTARMSLCLSVISREKLVQR